MNIRKKIVIFDFDGVLVNTLKVMEIAWSQVKKEFGIKKKFKDYKKLIGLPFFTILKKLKINKNQKKIYDVFNMISIKNENEVNLYTGVNETLKTLKNKGYKLAIVTSKDKNRASRLIKKFKIPIKNLNCPHKNFRGKPYPDQIFRAVKKSKILPSQIFYIGDMDVDYLLAKNSKINFIFCSYGYEKKKRKYFDKISKFSQIKKILSRYEKQNEV
mgnify:FL=1